MKKLILLLSVLGMLSCTRNTGLELTFHCTNIFVEKGRNTTNVGIPLQEEDTSPIVWI